MDNSERRISGVRSNWPVRLATAVGVGVGGAIALIWRPDVGGFWPGLIAYLAMMGVGGVVGRILAGLLCRPSSGEPPRSPPSA